MKWVMKKGVVLYHEGVKVSLYFLARFTFFAIDPDEVFAMFIYAQTIIHCFANRSFALFEFHFIFEDELKRRHFSCSDEANK